MAQKFYANPRDTLTHPNGAIAYRPGGPFDCLGPYAKVKNCPIEGTDLRLTCYATGYAQDAFSVPACTRHRGRYISGYFTGRDDGTVFVPHVRHWCHLGIPLIETWKHPAEFGWFVTVDGMQDTDLGYFSHEWQARESAEKAFPGRTVADMRSPLHSTNWSAK